MTKSYHQFKYQCREGDDFTIIAHRGASAYYPENTLPSFEGAISLGADMVEFDVQLTSDKEVVVFHDEKISRCSDGRGRIADYTLAALKKLNVGSWFGKNFKGTRIPTLEETLNACKGRVAVNIEIKTEAVGKTFFGGVEEKCLKLVDQIGMRKHAVFSSFDPRAIMHLKEIDNTVPAAVLFEKRIYGSMRPAEVIDSVGADAFNCKASELSSKWMADLRSKNIPVNIYTVNDRKNMQKFLHMGVNGIFTNKPDVLLKTLHAFKEESAGRGHAHIG